MLHRDSHQRGINLKRLPQNGPDYYNMLASDDDDDNSYRVMESTMSYKITLVQVVTNSYALAILLS